MRLLWWKLGFFFAYHQWPSAHWIELKKKAMREAQR